MSRFVDEDAPGPDGLSCFFHEVQQQSLTLFGLRGPADSETEPSDTRLIKCYSGHRFWENVDTEPSRLPLS